MSDLECCMFGGQEGSPEVTHESSPAGPRGVHAVPASGSQLVAALGLDEHGFGWGTGETDVPPVPGDLGLEVDRVPVEDEVCSVGCGLFGFRHAGQDTSDLGGYSGSTCRARLLLEFEAAHPRSNGTKDEGIRRELGLTPARYYQLLHRLIDTALAMRIDPMLTHRLRRLRDEATATRDARIAPTR